MAGKATASTSGQLLAALERPATDPPTPADGLCITCGGRRQELAVHHDDPFCTSPCARAFYGCGLDSREET